MQWRALTRLPHCSGGPTSVPSKLTKSSSPSSSSIRLCWWAFAAHTVLSSLTHALKAVGVNSMVTSVILVGLASQLWLRRYHPGWYRKYNYLLGAALDGGAQVMILILSFAVFGASGVSRPFPSVSCRLFYSNRSARGGADGCFLFSSGRETPLRET